MDTINFRAWEAGFWKDGFANMYLDDEFLLKYPPETVLDAYNKVLRLIPELANRQNSDALITAMVKRVITSNNEIDPWKARGGHYGQSDKGGFPCP